MRMILISAVSAALTIGAPAMAQDQTLSSEQHVSEPTTNDSSANVVPQTVEQNSADKLQSNRPASQVNTSQPAPESRTATNGFTATGRPDDNAILVSRMIGSPVYDRTNEDVGKISDVVFGRDGRVQAVIIGVGGFLGLGDKDVALPLDRVERTYDSSNRPKFTVQALRQDLEQAPAFDRTRLYVGGATSTAQ
ncbi:MAG: PRC-barrel domain-containing protein [Hyphomicrobiales bacterium]